MGAVGVEEEEQGWRMSCSCLILRPWQGLRGRHARKTLIRGDHKLNTGKDYAAGKEPPTCPFYLL